MSVYQSFVGSIIVIVNQKIPGNENIYLSGKLNVGSCLAPSPPPLPPQLWDIDLPDPTREPDRFACIMLGVDWIDDIEVNSSIYSASTF